MPATGNDEVAQRHNWGNASFAGDERSGTKSNTGKGAKQNVPELKLEKHPDQTAIGKTEKEFLY